MTLLALTRWSSEMLTYLAALFLLAAPLAAQEKNVEDYLPLAVGNSWTYLHRFIDDRQNTETAPMLLLPLEKGETEVHNIHPPHRDHRRGYLLRLL